MCLQCITDSVSLGEVLPGWYLHRARKSDSETDPDWPKDHWGLVQSNDPTFVWEWTPEPDLTFEKTDAEQNDMTEDQVEASSAWFIKANKFSEALVCEPHVGYVLTSAAMEAGYDREKHGRLGYWLFHRLSRFTRLQIME